MKSIFRLLVVSFLGLNLVMGLSGCHKDFDEPPVAELPVLTANTTIAQLVSMHTIGAPDMQITDTIIIEGVVIADDKSGNFYKQIIIQDATGGIEIRLDGTSLYTDYPIGRKVWVKCQGLFLGHYKGLSQLQGSGGQPIAAALIPEHIIGGQYEQFVTPKLKSINSLTAADINTLIQFDSVEFATSSVGQTFGDAVGLLSVNLTVKDCGAGTITLRSSGFANFAATPAPGGRGPMVAVMGCYSSDNILNSQDWQLGIRDLRDVPFYGPRCDGSGGGGGGGGSLMTIAAVRALFTGTLTNAPSGKTIQGIVISDLSTGNITGKNMVIQDATGGIVVRFTANNTLAKGDKVTIDISGMEISEFSGLLQLNNVPNSNAVLVNSGNTVTPVVTTIANLTANFEAMESTLITIQNATLSGPSTYSGTVTVTDPTGTVDLYTRTTATFAGTAVPTGTVGVTAIVSQFNTAQLTLRDANDVSGGGGGGTPTQMSVQDVRALFSGTLTHAPALTKIQGVVISDKDNGNITTKNLVVQDGAYGIVIRFTADHAFVLGERIEVNISGAEISEFNGLLQLNNVPLSNATSMGPGTMPTPRIATTTDIATNLEAWESTLVTIQNATLSGGTTFYGTLGSTTITDAAGTIVLFTRSQATFSGSPLTSGTVNVTGIVSQYTTPQINIRNLSDVQ